MENENFEKEQQKKWYQKTWGIILLLFLFFPAGLYFLWKSDFSKKSKLVWTVIIGILVLYSMGRNPQHQSVDYQSQQVQQVQQVEKTPEQIQAEKEEEIRKSIEEKVKRETESAKKRQESMMKDITTGWNNKTTDPEQSGNGRKASHLIREYADFVKNSPANYIDAADALKKPWDYYGKVVNLSGNVYSIQQAPPESEMPAYFGKPCFSAMLSIGDDPVYVSIWIIGNSDDLAEYNSINVKGFIYGHANLQNSMGGTNLRGLSFIGFRE